MKDYNFSNLRQNSGENRSLLIMIAFSMFFLTIWNIFFSPKESEIEKQNTKFEKNNQDNQQFQNQISLNKINNTIKEKRKKKEIFFNNNDYQVGIDVENNRISFLTLKKYKQHNNSVKNVVLLDDEHFVESGWIGEKNTGNDFIDWKIETKTNNTLTLVGTNKKLLGVKFNTKYTINSDYSIQIEQKILNNSQKDLSFSNYSRIVSKDTNERIENSYAFRGAISMIDDKINELRYDKIVKEQIIEKKTNMSGWIGYSEQYWLTALFNGNYNNEDQIYTSRYDKEKNIHQVDIQGKTFILKDKDEYVNKVVVIVAPKKLELLQKLGDKYNINKIDKAIDFGMFYFISKPLLIIIKKLYFISGNFGISIILLTILVRMIIFPLANKSYKTMARMRKLTPKLKSLQEQYKDDKKTLQVETFKLYREENVSPMSAVVPLFLQIPIFFALYKVLIIAIEMRDAPFVGWITDLSSKDPSSIFNLFGLLSYNVPQVLQIGLLPVLMGITMFIQQKLNPSVMPDKTQQKIMNMMPLFMTIFLASMPAGLILYWICSNIFTIIQQTIIIRVLNKEK